MNRESPPLFFCLVSGSAQRHWKECPVCLRNLWKDPRDYQRRRTKKTKKPLPSPLFFLLQCPIGSGHRVLYIEKRKRRRDSRSRGGLPLPLLYCTYNVLEWHSFSMMSEVV